jgi:hypothetical protein
MPDLSLRRQRSLSKEEEGNRFVGRIGREVLERKGLLTKQEVREVITELRGRTPQAEQANPPIEAIPEPYVMTEIEDKIIQAILDLLNANNLTARQAKALLGRLNQLIDVGEMLAHKTMH